MFFYYLYEHFGLPMFPRQHLRCNLLFGLATDSMESADLIGSKRDLLIGDVFLCAACISYYGAFSGPYRKALVSSWVGKFQVHPSTHYLLKDNLFKECTYCFAK